MFSYDHAGSSQVSQLSDVSPRHAPKRKTGHFNASLRKCAFSEASCSPSGCPPASNYQASTKNAKPKLENHEPSDGNMFSYDHVGSSQVSQLSDVSPKACSKTKNRAFQCQLKKVYIFRSKLFVHQAAPLASAYQASTKNAKPKLENHEPSGRQYVQL